MAATKEEVRQHNLLPYQWRSSRKLGIFRNVEQNLINAGNYGFKFDPNMNSWYILIDGKNYYCNDTSILEEFWGDPYIYLGDRNPWNDDKNRVQIIAKKDGVYDVLLDENGNEYYIDILGKKHYGRPEAGYDARANLTIQRDLGNRSDLLDDPNVVIQDILGNRIVPKTPVHGLYNSVKYFEEVKQKKDQYIEFYTTKNKTALLKRAKDIISQQDALIKILNEAGVGVTKEAVFMGGVALTLGIAAKVGASVPFAGKLIGFLSSEATVRPVAERAYAQQEDLIVLQLELEAIEKFALNITNDAAGGSPKASLSTPQIIVIGLILAIIVFLIWRYYRR